MKNVGYVNDYTALKNICFYIQRAYKEENLMNNIFSI